MAILIESTRVPARRGLRVVLARRWRNRRTRQQLAGPSPELLADVGLGAAEARREAVRPFWSG